MWFGGGYLSIWLTSDAWVLETVEGCQIEWVRGGGGVGVLSGKRVTHILRTDDLQLGGRGSENSGQASMQEVSGTVRLVVGPSFSEAQERQLFLTGFQSETAEKFCQIQAFQDGRHPGNFGLDPNRSLDDYRHSQWCLFHAEYGPRDQEIPAVSVEMISVRGVPIQPRLSTQDVHLIAPVTDGISEKE